MGIDEIKKMAKHTHDIDLSDEEAQYVLKETNKRFSEKMDKIRINGTSQAINPVGLISSHYKNK